MVGLSFTADASKHLLIYSSLSQRLTTTAQGDGVVVHTLFLLLCSRWALVVEEALV